MKILEAQSAILTNYEVYTHLTAQRARYATGALKGRRPGNLETVVKEILEYLREAPSPLGSKPFPYHENIIKNLLEKLRPWDFSKAEILMILNLRPTKPENLNTIVEEMEDRFDEAAQLDIVNAIAEVLGQPDGQAERKAMVDNAAEARKVHDEMEDAKVEA